MNSRKWRATTPTRAGRPPTSQPRPIGREVDIEPELRPASPESLRDFGANAVCRGNIDCVSRGDENMDVDEARPPDLGDMTGVVGERIARGHIIHDGVH